MFFFPSEISKTLPGTCQFSKTLPGTCEFIYKTISPFLRLSFRVDDYGDKVYSQCLAMVDYTGSVFWAPIANLRSTCKLDLTFFPFDDQICYFKIGSWTYDGFQVRHHFSFPNNNLLQAICLSGIISYFITYKIYIISIMIIYNKCNYNSIHWSVWTTKQYAKLYISFLWS